MFGLYRFVLAVLVALSHFGVQPGGFNPGQWAVISFYILSGVLMERQFGKLSGNGNGTSKFYLDRFLRIYPLFIVVLLLACAETITSWGTAMINGTLFPLNYGYFTKIPVLITPAWSLACEAHFYLLVPLLALCSTQTVRLLLGLSLGLFAISPLLPFATFWAYIGLPGILFTFLSGILINRKDFGFLKILWPIMFFQLMVFGAAKYAHSGWRTGIHVNVAVGYLVALMAVPCLDRFSANVKWDKFFGLFSYPLFLCHPIVAVFAKSVWPAANALELLFASLLFTGILILTVEIPFDRLRYRVRGFGASLRQPSATG
jgi:peptidoglycan/LPS O-acetylase OafA/YrhL